MVSESCHHNVVCMQLRIISRVYVLAKICIHTYAHWHRSHLILFRADDYSNEVADRGVEDEDDLEIFCKNNVGCQNAIDQGYIKRMGVQDDDGCGERL